MAGVVAGAVGALLSGAPSTALTLVEGGDVFDSTRAVGRALLAADAGDAELFVAGGLAHVVISLTWGVVLSKVLPRRHTVLAGIATGGAIAVLDLGIIGRRLPSIRALEPLPEVLDHLAYGAVVGYVLSRRRAG